MVIRLALTWFQRDFIKGLTFDIIPSVPVHERQSLLSYFWESRKAAQLMARREIERVNAGLSAWTIYNSSISDYEGNFLPYLREGFDAFLKRRKLVKGKVFVMDVMGQGGFYKDYDVDGEVTVTLVDFRNCQQKQIDCLEHNKVIIEGDILKGKTWQQAKEFINQYDDTELPGFDLIVCRPVGGWYHGTSEKGSLFMELIFINKMVNLLSPLGGTLLVTSFCNGSDRYFWLKDLKKIEGIEAVGSYAGTRITKTGFFNPKLPKITALWKD